MNTERTDLFQQIYGALEGTVADRVMAAFDHVPEPGEEIDLDALHIEIEAVENGAVATVIVGNRPTQDTSADS